MTDPSRFASLAALAAALSLTACGSSSNCPSGQTPCLGTCRDLQSDPASCGQCGFRCAAGGRCVNGACTCPPAAPVSCGGGCFDLSTDAKHCGACDHDCGQGTCSGGACACSAPAADCGSGSRPQCVDTQNDYVNCGGCGLRCTRTGGICSGGACACPTSRPQFCAAADLCADLATDPTNCGACGASCTIPSQVCQNGQCICPATRPNTCGNTCVNLQTDARNCGSCGRVCAGGNCTSGKCCPGVQVECGSLCCDGGCCPGGTCVIKHDAGTGLPSAIFSDCSPLGSKAAAQEAARRWKPSGGPVTTYDGQGCSFVTECVAWNAGTVPNQCGVWCYDGAALVKGKVKIESISGVCLCPDSGSGPWR